jgi:hypothetical protein
MTCAMREWAASRQTGLALVEAYAVGVKRSLPPHLISESLPDLR